LSFKETSMNRNAGVLAVVVLATAAVLVGFWGCGMGPLEQSYAVQSGAESVNSAIGEKTEVPELMKQMRTAHLDLVDRLTAGSPDQIMDAAARVSLIAGNVGKYQPAVGKGAAEEAALFKRFSEDIKDYAVEVAKAAASGRFKEADAYYTRLFTTCNTCHRAFRGIVKTAPVDIPQLETPKPVPDNATTAPEPAPQPPAGN
jgi:cytochrome c556